MTTDNLYAVVGWPDTANAITATVSSAAEHRTMTAGGHYEACFNVDVRFQLTSADTSAATDTGAFIPARIPYNFQTDNDNIYFSYISQDGGTGKGTITPKIVTKY